MAVTVTPTETLVSGVNPNYIVQFDLADTVQYTDSANPISMYVNDVLVEPYVDIYYSSTSGTPRTRMRIEYVPKIPWEPGQYYTPTIIYDDVEYGYTFRATTSAYKDTDSRTYLSPVCQKMANSFPEYSYIRQDEFSAGQQLLMPFANRLSELYSNVWEHRLNSAATSAQINQTYELGNAHFYEGYLSGYENLETILNTKTIKGQDNLTLTDISTIADNSIRTAYLYNTPDRVSVERFQDIGAINIASLSLGNSFNQLDQSFSSPVRIFITVENGMGLISKAGIDILRPTIVTVKGLDDNSKRISERFSFISNSTVTSRFTWSKILSVTIDSEATAGDILISKLPPALATKIDPVELVWPSWNPTGGRVIWAIVEDPANNNFILQCNFRPSQTIEAEGLPFTENSNPGIFDNPLNSMLYKEYILLDENGNRIEVEDFAIDFAKPWVYVLGRDLNNNQNIYIYHKYDEYPSNIKIAEKRDFECPLKIAEFDIFGNTLRDGILDLTLTTKFDQTRKVLYYEWSVLLPDGSINFISPTGALQPTNSGCRIQNDYAEQFRLDPKIITVALDTPGLYQFRLFTKYVDGIESIDVRYFNVRQKQPLFKYPTNFIRYDNSYIAADDQLFIDDANYARNLSFGWRPGRFTVIGSESSSQLVCQIPSSVNTNSLTFLVNSSTVSSAFGAFSSDNATCTLSNFPVIQPDSTIVVTIKDGTTLDDEFQLFKIGEFSRLTVSPNGILGLTTSNGFQALLKLKQDVGIYDENNNQFFTLVPYSRVLVIE